MTLGIIGLAVAIKDQPKLKAFLINTLRRASYRHPGRYLAVKASRVGRNEYVCACCGVIHGRRDGAMDHIQPVVDPSIGWVDLDNYAERMFVNEHGYARLCNQCHDTKTLQENNIRKETKQKKKLDI